MAHAIPDAVLAHHAAVLGKTGGGKTSTTKLAIEQVVAEGFRVCILDTAKSDWWGMISSADGKKPGLPFRILGGPHGHIPLPSSAGGAVGQLVATGKLPLSIVDMADFEMGGVQHFFVDFATALMRHMKGVLYLVIEEAHEVAPKERAGFGGENMAIHWAKKLATAGRSKGIRLIVATQRVQALHNAVLGSCETLIAHRLTTPADQKPVLDWVKANVPSKEIQREVAESLSSLPTGTGWLCSGEAQIFERVAFPKFKTFDNTATPTSDDEEIAIKKASVDAAELRSIIGDAVKEAEENDPKLLKAEIARLKRSKPEAPAPVSPAWPDQRADVDRLQSRISELSQVLADVAPHLRLAFEAVREFSPIAMGKQPRANGKTEATPMDVPKPRIAAAPSTQSSPSGLSPGEKAILIAAVQYGGVDRDQLSVLTGYKRSSRNAYIARLKAKGLVETTGENVQPTDAAADALGSDYEPLPRGVELQDYWMARLPVGEAAILAILVGKYPAAVDRSDLDDLTGYKRSSRNAYIARLKARRLVEVAGEGVSASGTLF